MIASEKEVDAFNAINEEDIAVNDAPAVANNDEAMNVVVETAAKYTLKKRAEMLVLYLQNVNKPMQLKQLI